MSTTEQAPMTWPQIKAAIDKMAPFPPEDQPVTARGLAKTMAVTAQRRWWRNLSGYFAGTDAATQQRFSESIHAMCDEFAALHLLMAFIEADPRKADEVATQIRDAWNDGGGIGEWLWEHEQALGVDTDEVNRLEDAWQALPQTQTTAEQERDEARAKLAKAEALIGQLERITTAWTRGMYSARIDCWRGDAKAAAGCLSEGLDGYDGPEWNGTETGAEWWERTKAEEGL